MKAIIIEYKKEHSCREKLLLFLLGEVIPIHAKFYSKRKPWGMKRADLLRYPQGTLGHELAIFLKEEELEPVDRVERHDAFHILFDYTTEIRDEAAMQFFLVGNGKISPFTVGTMMFSALVLPEEWKYFRAAYKRGKMFRSIAKWDFRQLLNENFEDVKKAVRREEVKNARLLNLIRNMESGSLKSKTYELQ